MDLAFCERVNALCAVCPASWESADRTPRHNASVGGKSASWHLKGQAVDLIYDTIESLHTAARIAIDQGFQGVEMDEKNWHLHVDGRTERWHVAYYMHPTTLMRTEESLTLYLSQV